MKGLKEKMKHPAPISAIVAVVFGLLIHMFGLTNSMHNYDDITALPQGVGGTLSSGRWFLLILRVIGNATVGNFNLPWFDGLLFLVLLGVSTCFLVLLFKPQKHLYGILIGMVFVSFPTVTSTLFFKFTAPQYGLAILFSVAAVWAVERWKHGYLVGMCLLALSLGIYQSYFPLAVSISVLLIIKMLLSDETTVVSAVKRGLLYLGTLVGGLLAYLIALKVLLTIGGITLSSYQGIDRMGQFSLWEMVDRVLVAVKNALLFPITGYCNLATASVLKIAYIVLGVISVFLLIWLLVQKKSIVRKLLIIALFSVIPLCVNLIVVMGATSVYTLMVLPFFLLACVPLLLFEHVTAIKGETIFKWIKCIALGMVILIIGCNTYIANVNYSAMYFSSRQVENFYNSVATQVHMTEGYDTTKTWVFIGKLDDEYFNQEKWAGKHTYGGNAVAYNLINADVEGNWSANYLGHLYKTASEEQKEILEQRQEIQEMPCWPNNGSVKVIDEFVVIKLGTPEKKTEK